MGSIHRDVSEKLPPRSPGLHVADGTLRSKGGAAMMFLYSVKYTIYGVRDDLPLPAKMYLQS